MGGNRARPQVLGSPDTRPPPAAPPDSGAPLSPDPFAGDILPAPQEDGPDDQGIKTITTFRRNDKGQVEKVGPRERKSGGQRVRGCGWTAPPARARSDDIARVRVACCAGGARGCLWQAVKSGVTPVSSLSHFPPHPFPPPTPPLSSLAFSQVVKKVKVFTQRRVVPVSVELRRDSWRPFGEAVKQTEGITYSSFEEVKIEKPDVQQKSQLEVLQETTTSLVVCRRCGGAHWTLGCPFKDVQGPIGGRTGAAGAAPGGGSNAGAGPDGGAGGGGGGGGGGGMAGSLGVGSGKYVPPSQRGMPANGEEREVPLEELTQLRVSNLSEDVEEDDLRQLFRPFGHVDKIFLARDKITNVPRGFAFVRYMRHDEAGAAMGALNGLPFMHLILRVEWSRPDNRAPGAGGPGGASSAHYTGYGKKLAQDVVKK